MKKLSINVIAEISIFAAIGFILDIVGEMFPSPAWANGGTISVAMVAIFIIGYRRGVLPAVICGLLIGLLDMTGKIYVIADTWWKAFIQVALDYWLCYAVVGLGAILFPIAKKVQSNIKFVYLGLGVFLGAFLKFVCHWFSGSLFFGIYAPEGESKYWYSTYYNAGYMIPCFVLTLILMIIIAGKYEQQILAVNEQSKLQNKGGKYDEI